MPRTRLVDGVRINFTAEEEAARDAEEAQAAIDSQARKDAEDARKANRISGKEKLKAGEALTDAEVEALFG